MDIVIEGTIAWIDDPWRLHRIGVVYQDKYGWPVTVVGDTFHAPYAAPAARAPGRV